MNKAANVYIKDVSVRNADMGIQIGECYFCSVVDVTVQADSEWRRKLVCTPMPPPPRAFRQAMWPPEAATPWPPRCGRQHVVRVRRVA